jgi:hypothetical protein
LPLLLITIGIIGLAALLYEKLEKGFHKEAKMINLIGKIMDMAGVVFVGLSQ